jgi:CubicO group peptidase (beta-lactamase class C family)
MKAKQFSLTWILMAIVLTASGCTSASKEPPIIVPEITLEGTAWTLEAFIENQASSSPIGGTQITVMFAAGSVRGSAGCNDYGGAYTLERGAFRVPQLDIHEQLCLEPAGIMDQENKYLKILHEVTTFAWDADQLTLQAADGIGLIFISAEDAAVASQSGPTDPLELENFLDAYFAEQMAALHVPGATFALVKDGDIFLAKGYGYANIEKQIPYASNKTIFWAASIAKIFSVIEVMKLYEQDLIHLEDDVNQYLVDFQIPEDYPQPVKFRHLLTHTDGFEARIIGDAARTPADLEDLHTVVENNLPSRIATPGQFLTYGNFGTNLAGVLIEDISGIPFAAFMDANIFQPLEMHRTTFEQVLPSEWTDDLAIGYGYSDGIYEPKPFVYVNSLPQGGGRSTATDMAHFMIALLQGGRYGGARILDDDTVQLMFQQQFSAHPRIGGITYGLFEIYRNDQRLLIRDGDGWGFRSRMVLIPDQNLGFFVNYNNEDADILREDLVDQFLDHYFPITTQESPAPRADFKERAGQFTGIYRPLQADESSFFKIALLFAQQIRVTDGKDGTLLVAPVGMGDNYGAFDGESRWVENEPLLFQRVDGVGNLAFGKDESGKIEYLFSGQKYHGTYRKIAWYETPGLHFTLLIVSAFLFLITLILWPVRAWLKRRRGAVPPTWPRLALLSAWTVCALHLVFIAAIAVVMGNFVDVIYGVPPLLSVALILPLLAVGLTIAQLVMTVQAWRERYGSAWGRIYYTLLTVIVLAFTWWLNYWNLLGNRY